MSKKLINFIGKKLGAWFVCTPEMSSQNFSPLLATMLALLILSKTRVME